MCPCFVLTFVVGLDRCTLFSTLIVMVRFCLLRCRYYPSNDADGGESCVSLGAIGVITHSWTTSRQYWLIRWWYQVVGGLIVGKLSPVRSSLIIHFDRVIKEQVISSSQFLSGHLSS